jgi:hypothetical protein
MTLYYYSLQSEPFLVITGVEECFLAANGVEFLSYGKRKDFYSRS